MENIYFKKYLKQFSKFAAVGLISTTVNYSIFYYLFRFLDVHYLAASACGFITGVFVSYSLNRKFTFRSENDSRIKEFFAYLYVCLFSLGLSLITLRFGVETIRLNPLLANLFAIGVSTLSNFYGAKILVFKK